MAKLLDFFARRRHQAPAPGTLEPDAAAWSIVTVRNESKNAAGVSRVRFERPVRPDVSLLRTAIVIKWHYEPSTGMPPADVRRAQGNFEEALDPLAPNENSELVHVFTGMGLKEWIYYARSRERFMAELNDLLSSQETFPVAIEFYDDPDWRVWSDMVDPLRGRV